MSLYLLNAGRNALILREYAGTTLAFPLAIHVSQAVVDAMVRQIIESLVHHGIRKVLILNGHGGNTATLGNAAQRLQREKGLNVAVVDWWWEVQKLAVEIFGEGGMGHAAIDEMAMLAGLR